MRPKFVLWSLSGIIAILLALGGIFVGFRTQAETAHNNCVAGNEVRQSLVKVFDQLRPAGLIRKPGETDEQYQFRQKQTADGYALLHRQLAPRKC